MLFCNDVFRRLLELCPEGAIAVNSSPFGLPFCRRLGFSADDGEQVVHGIRFTSMSCSAE